MDIITVKQYVQKGLEKGYREHLEFISSDNDLVYGIREYLLTVNVAQALNRWDKPFSYRIYLEYPVLKFFINAFPSTRIEAADIFNMKIVSREPGHSPTTSYNQKIDIVIVEEQVGFITNERSLVGIELKGINQSVPDITQDVKRLANAMIRTDKIDGNSIIFCLCAFLRRFDKAEELVMASTIQEQNNREQERWKVICDNLTKEFSQLSFETEIFDIVSKPYETIAAKYHLTDDYHEIANETGRVAGILLSITRNNIE
jgi:hypothetical protein